MAVIRLITSPETTFGQDQTKTNDDSSATLRFLVTGEATDADAAAVVIASGLCPSTYQGLNRAQIMPRSIGLDQWECQVRYDKRTPQNTGDQIFSFDTSGESFHLTHAREHVNSYAPAGQVAPDFKGAINATLDPTNPTIEGVDITLGGFSFTVTRYIPNDAINDFKTLIRDCSWHYNSDTVELSVNGLTETFEAGELLFKSATGKPRSDDWEVTMNFASEKNATDIAVGSITVSEKLGFDYLWVLNEIKVDAAANALVQVPKAVYVERVYDTAELSGLFS